MRAWRDLRFGDSLELVAEKLLAYEDMRLNGRTQMSVATAEMVRDSIKSRTVRSLQVKLDSFTFALLLQFSENGLYMIDLQTEYSVGSLTRNYILAAYEFLVDLITQSKGPADDARVLTRGDLHDRKIAVSHTWNPNSERVAYFIGLGSRDGEISSVLSIEWVEEANRVRETQRAKLQPYAQQF